MRPERDLSQDGGHFWDQCSRCGELAQPPTGIPSRFALNLRALCPDTRMIGPAAAAGPRNASPGSPMYLAKFFHRPPGKDDRELLLIFDGGCGESHAFMGFVLNGRSEPYMRRDFASPREAVAAFRVAAEELREAGYVE